MAKKTTSTKTARPVSKSELLAKLANKTGLTRKQVASIFDGLTGMIGEGLSNRGPGTFVIPGLVKLQVQHKLAVPEHPGKNPFTGEDIMVKAKPARNVVKVRPLKKLKQMV